MVDIEKKLCDILENIIDNDLDDNENINNLKSIINEYPYFQSIYIILAKKLHKINSPSKQKALELASLYSTDRLYLKQIINSQTSQKVAKDKKILKENDISIPEKITDDSVFNDNMITESLAKIMVQQDKIELAIKIYNRLILKFPQKKAYFVRILNKLKTKL
ncbi:MAG: hypothetical protein GY830_06935 [Bacteroidetes bacterium]|nr:hypothetical protein [Bacteroidota bacterium]